VASLPPVLLTFQSKVDGTLWPIGMRSINTWGGKNSSGIKSVSAPRKIPTPWCKAPRAQRSSRLGRTMSRPGFLADVENLELSEGITPFGVILK